MCEYPGKNPEVTSCSSGSEACTLRFLRLEGMTLDCTAYLHRSRVVWTSACRRYLSRALPEGAQWPVEQLQQVCSPWKSPSSLYPISFLDCFSQKSESFQWTCRWKAWNCSGFVESWISAKAKVPSISIHDVALCKGPCSLGT